jgi:excisionase family DNA binding protein
MVQRCARLRSNNVQKNGILAVGWNCGSPSTCTPDVVQSETFGGYKFMQRILLSRRKAAYLLAISVRKLDQLIKTKLLTGIKIGKRVLISHSDVERFAMSGTASGKGGRRGK